MKQLATIQSIAACTLANAQILEPDTDGVFYVLALAPLRSQILWISLS